MSKGDDIDAIIANGISWGRGGASSAKTGDGKVKTRQRIGKAKGQIPRAACQ